MACTISLGRLEGCKDSVGGLKAAYLINFEDATFNITNSTATVVETTPAAFKYDLRGTSSFDQSITSSRDSGTTFVEQTLTLSLKSQDAATHKEVMQMAYGRPKILIEDNNGTVYVMGAEYGAELTGSTSTGAAMGDKSGYELTFVAMEKELAPITSEDLATIYAITLGA